MGLYLSEENCYQRLEDEFKKYGKLVFCVDYDNTLYDCHNKGMNFNEIFTLLRRWEKYSEVIIFSVSKEDRYPEMEKYLNDNNIKFKGINCDGSVICNPDCRKIYANVYIDDRAGLPTVYRNLCKLISKIEKGEVIYENI